SLPPEILGEIFEAYINSPSLCAPWSDSNALSTEGGDSPMILGQICSYWRTVAIGMPAIWSSLYIENPVPDHVGLVAAWLERAGTCGLDLVLRDWMDSEVRGCSAGTEAVLHLFVEKSRSWRSIDFVIELYDSAIFDLLDLDGFPILESVSLHARYLDQGALDTLWSKIHRSPVLRHVDWQRAFKGVGLPSHAAWTQLRSITTRRPLSDEEILFILRACPDLTKLDARHTNSVSSLPPPPTSTTESGHTQYHRLESLALHITSDSTTFFDYVSLPNLKSLCLNNLHGFFSMSLNETIGKPIEELLRRSQCRLHELKILHFDCAQTQLLPYLLHFPATQDLKSFDVYPLDKHAEGFDVLVKHPAQCVRNVGALAMEEPKVTVAVVVMPSTKKVVVGLTGMTCDNEEDEDTEVEDEPDWKHHYGFEADVVCGDDLMTPIQAHLAQLHFSD
ncbi:hypothetical protein AN958_03186, partial [Leucoagaricus sp. SymC.cos]